MTGGASIAPDDYVDVGYRTIPKGAVNSSGVADMSGCKNVSENFFKKNISSKTSSGELVTSLRDLVPTAPNMGRIVRICGETEDFLMPQGVYSIIVKEKISEDFLLNGVRALLGVSITGGGRLKEENAQRKKMLCFGSCKATCITFIRRSELSMQKEEIRTLRYFPAAFPIHSVPVQ